MHNDKPQTDDKHAIDKLIASFFSIFANVNNHQPDWESIHHLCIPEAMIIKKD